ncbi:MAG: LysR family transcriptional regulator [Rhizobiales bacterium]|nr:LysR family transcriptional regulator [Hyphomicrobiales bacterium]
MPQISLRQLRYFDALARHGHFGRAAEACSVTQPALSMQVRELEEALGAVLVERGARTVRLTGFGAEAARRAREILRSVDDLGDAARASMGRLAGRLRVGIIPTVAPYLLPLVIGDLARTHPDLDLNVREAVTQKLVEELRDGRLDAAIVALPISEPSLVEVALFSESFLLVRPRANAHLPVPDAKALAEMRLLLLEEGHCFRDQALSFCAIDSALPRDLLDASSLSTLVQMVGAGIGVTLIPEMAVAVETRSAAVVVDRFEEPQPRRTIGMVWRNANPLARQFTEITQSVRRSASALSEPAGKRARPRRTPRR